MGQYSVNLVGESYRQPAIQTLRVGDRIDLVHDQGNPHDDCAVKAITVDGLQIGFVPRDSFIQRLVAVEGKKLYAEIQAVTGGVKGKRHKGVVLLVATSKDATALFNESPEARTRRLGASAKSGCLSALAIGLTLPIGYWIGG